MTVVEWLPTCDDSADSVIQAVAVWDDMKLVYSKDNQCEPTWIPFFVAIVE